MTAKFDARAVLAAHLNIDIEALRRKYVFQREVQLALDEVAELVDFWAKAQIQRRVARGWAKALSQLNQVDDEVNQ